MSIMSREVSGLVYTTDFSSLDSGWEISDLERIILGEDGLVISPGEDVFTMMYRPLSELTHFLIEMENKYNPTKDGEYGGFVVYGDEENFIRLEEYFNEDKGTSHTYRWVRLVRDKRVFSGYGSQDGLSWELIGSHSINNNNPKIGVFLEGDSREMEILRINIYKSPTVTVVQAPKTDTIRLVTDEGVVHSLEVRGAEPKVEFNVANEILPLNGWFEWESIHGTDRTNFIREIWGGDVFRFNIGLDLYYEKDDKFIRVDANTEEFLGYVNEIGEGVVGETFFKMCLENMQKIVCEDVRVKVMPHSENKEHYKYITLAPTEDGDYSREVKLGDIAREGRKEFWVRLERPPQGSTDLLGEIFFRLMPTADVIKEERGE